MITYKRLLHEIQTASAVAADRKALLGPVPIAHTKQLEQELPRLRQYLGPRPWYAWLERLTPNTPRT